MLGGQYTHSTGVEAGFDTGKPVHGNLADGEVVHNGLADGKPIVGDDG